MPYVETSPGPFSEYCCFSPNGGGIGFVLVDLLVAFGCMKNEGQKAPSPLRVHGTLVLLSKVVLAYCC